MKKFNLVKLASIALAITMLMGSFVFTAIAADETTGEVAAYNVYYGDRYQLMFAVNAPDGATITVEDSEGNELKYVSFEEDPTPTIDGVVCDAYIVSEGVAIQAIDEIITVTIEYAGEELDSRSYSVLEYVYERIYVDKVEGAELAMYEALLAYADAADAYFNPDDEAGIGDLVYVNTTDCTFNDGATSGLVTNGDTVYFETDKTAEAGYEVKFVITNLEKNTETKISAEKMSEEGYIVNSSISVKAVVEESNDGPVTESMNIYANKGDLGTDTISWTNGNITVTNNKASSTTDIRTSDTDHFRVYAKSELVISCNGKLQTVVITTTGSTYATALKTSLTNAGYTVSVSGNVVTVTLDSTVSTITFTASAQTRINKVEVTYISQ